LRAGLLSEPKVIAQLNQRFVCTSVIIDDVENRAAGGDPLAKQLAAHWEYPVEMIFLRPDCTLVSKLSTFKDFPAPMHPDVCAPPGKVYPGMTAPSNSEVFLNHVALHFGEAVHD
jgi:hypothetical protein